jgi:hypothetical protein
MQLLVLAAEENGKNTKAITPVTYMNVSAVRTADHPPESAATVVMVIGEENQRNRKRQEEQDDSYRELSPPDGHN